MHRRSFLSGIALSGIAATTLGAVGPAQALDARELGLFPDDVADQSALFTDALRRAASENRPLAMPPGPIVAGEIDLPENCRLSGAPGASRIIHNGGAFLLRGRDVRHIHLSGIMLDGANRPFAEEATGLLTARHCDDVQLSRCEFRNSQTNGLYLQQCGGRIDSCTIADITGWAGLYCVNASRLAVTDNVVRDCANGGILVHRWEVGADGTMVAGNRVSGIRAEEGGTGQWGNGINLFRADNVMVRGNHVSDCAFSAIRANSASNALIDSNICLRSGEVAVYAEFAFSGSVINSNLIDDAATGISIANFNEGGRLVVCNDNLVRNIRTTGPYVEEGVAFGVGIYAEADTSIGGNVVESAPLYGIEIGFGPFQRNVVAAGNIVREAGVGMTASVTPGAGSAMVTGNRLSGLKRAAIAGTDHGKVVTGDLTLAGARRFEHLTIDGNSIG